MKIDNKLDLMRIASQFQALQPITINGEKDAILLNVSSLNQIGKNIERIIREEDNK